MESNKENMNRVKINTRIPLPVEPLPALPKHLVESKKDKMIKETNERYPLKTLNSHPNLAVPGPSQNAKYVDNHPKNLMIDARYVTRRHRVENLDWNYKVFKDDRTNDVDDDVVPVSDEVILLSDEEDSNQSHEYKIFVRNNQFVEKKNCLEEPRIAVTPSLNDPSVENNRVRNIKRSLKRPHSRELQGLSHVAKEQKNGDDRVKRRLYFKESLNDRLMSPDFLKKSYMESFLRDYGDETFSYLVNFEKITMPARISSVLRACVINWLIKINGTDGNPAIVQAAIWYLDSVLSFKSVELENLQLVAAACYWIAHKIHGPGLSASRLIQCSRFAFTAEGLLSAEKAVLGKLKFPPLPVVPQEYITYLAWCCNNTGPGEIEVAATFLCMSGQMVDKSLCKDGPSVIAAAAVMNALLLLKKPDQIIKLQNNSLYRTAKYKAANFSNTCAILQRAARTIGCPLYDYRALVDHYGTPPYYMAQRVIIAANDLHKLEVKYTRQNI